MNHNQIFASSITVSNKKITPTNTLPKKRANRNYTLHCYSYAKHLNNSSNSSPKGYGIISNDTLNLYQSLVLISTNANIKCFNCYLFKSFKAIIQCISKSKVKSYYCGKTMIIDEDINI